MVNALIRPTALFNAMFYSLKQVIRFTSLINNTYLVTAPLLRTLTTLRMQVNPQQRRPTYFALDWI